MYKVSLNISFIVIIIHFLGVEAMGEALICAEQKFTVGKQIVVNCNSPKNSFAVVFEDDGETGYFYGLDTSREENPILDALHIYNVNNVTDKDIPSVVQIVWSDDGKKALLMINEYPHAAFDFVAKRGYCRTNFPTPDHKWTKYGHEWDDSVMKLF